MTDIDAHQRMVAHYFGLLFLACAAADICVVLVRRYRKRRRA